LCFQRRSGLHSAGQDVQCRSDYAVQSSTELHSAAPQAVVSVSSAVQIRLAEKARANPNPALTLIRGVRSCADSDGASYSLTCHRPTHLDANQSREEGLSFARPRAKLAAVLVSRSQSSQECKLRWQHNALPCGIETTTTTNIYSTTLVLPNLYAIEACVALTLT
jgi:hypothetical protein